MADSFTGYDEPATVDKKLASDLRTRGADAVHLQQITILDATLERGTKVSVAGGLLTTHDVTGIGDGRKVVTTAGTRVTLAATTTAKYVVVTAETDNTGTIVVGGATVVATLATRQGTPLAAGDTVGIPVDDLADVYLDSTVSSDGVTFAYQT